MKIVETPLIDPQDPLYAAAFRKRVRHIARFIEGVNNHLDEDVELLAVRNGSKFDFVMKTRLGHVLAAMRPIADPATGGLDGVFMQMSGGDVSSGEFGSASSEIRAASVLVSSHLPTAGRAQKR